MKMCDFPRPFRDPSERGLTGRVPASFEAFYRAQLRYRTGAKMRSLDIAQRYCAWAEEVDAPSMSMKEVARAMLHVGHRRFRSNQTYFADVQLASDAPNLADNFPVGASADTETIALLSSIDRIDTELNRLRRAVTAASPR